MADQDIMHTAEIMKAALPFINIGNKVMVEFFMKIFDLMGSLKMLKSNRNVAASGFEAGNIDLEGMLNGIRPICGIKEREIIDRILNIFQMKRMFEMYTKMMEMMQNMPDFSGFDFNGFDFSGFDFGNAGNSGNNGETGNNGEAGNNGGFWNNTGSGNTGESNNTGGFWNNSGFGNSEESDNTKGFWNNTNSGQQEDDTENVTSNFGGSNFDSIFNTTDGSKSAEEKDEWDFTGNFEHTGSTSADTDKDKTSQNNIDGNFNDKMLNMLKAMVPPEQMGTFKNLSMLLNSMSYDNNSKPDASKEHDNANS